MDHYSLGSDGKMVIEEIEEQDDSRVLEAWQIVEKLNAYHVRVAELEKDEARLDWVEERAAYLEPTPLATGGSDYESGWTVIIGEEDWVHESIRKAIDAAKDG